MKKIGLFIDYANLLASLRRRNIAFLDFKLLLDFLNTELHGKIEYKSLFFAYPEDNTRTYDVSGIHKFAVFLNKSLGFNITKKPLKQIEIRDEKGKTLYDVTGNPIIVEKGNLDIELTMDIMHTWQNFDTIVLFSGDSDFKCLTQFLLKQKKDIYVFSTFGNISTELKTHSTRYYDIDDLPIGIAKYKTKKESSSN